MPVETIPLIMGANRPERYSNGLTITGTDRFTGNAYRGGKYYAFGRTAISIATQPLIARHDPFGQILWLKRINTPALIGFAGHISGNIDSVGNLIVVFGGSNTLVTVMKLDLDGNVVWQINYSRGATIQLANSSFMTVDSAGDPIVGLSASNPVAFNDNIVKLDGSDGTEIWQRAISHPEGTRLGVRAFAVDAADRPVVSVNWDASPDQAAIMRFNTDGTNESAVQISLPDEPASSDIFVGSQGNIYNGVQVGLGGGGLSYIMKFNASLAFQWGRSYSVRDFRRLTAIANETRVIVAGDDDTDGWLVSLDGDGTELSQKNAVGADNQFRAVAAEQDVNLLIAAATAAGSSYLAKGAPDLSDLLDGNGITYTDGSLTQATVNPAVVSLTPPNVASTTFTRSTPTFSAIDVPFTENLITGF